MLFPYNPRDKWHRTPFALRSDLANVTPRCGAQVKYILFIFNWLRLTSGVCWFSQRIGSWRNLSVKIKIQKLRLNYDIQKLLKCEIKCIWLSVYMFVFNLKHSSTNLYNILRILNYNMFKRIIIFNYKNTTQIYAFCQLVDHKNYQY